jgi:hypothetical protein
MEMKRISVNSRNTGGEKNGSYRTEKSGKGV